MIEQTNSPNRIRPNSISPKLSDKPYESLRKVSFDPRKGD